MKFRAVMKDPQYMREFQNIILTLSKLSKECVMNISADKVHFIVNEESGTAAPLVWVEIDAKLYFPEYKMQGNSSSSNANTSTTAESTNTQIMLCLSTINLGRSLAALRNNPRYCKMKLTNIQFPCLTIEADVIPQSGSEQSRQVAHDVPVNLIPRSEWPVYALPQIPVSKVILTVPSNRLMRSLIDKLKNLSPTIIFYATSNGEMNLVAETEMATITTRYKNLEIRALNPNREEDQTKQLIEASCAVDCKKTSIFFTALQVPTLELSCGIDDQRLIHMEVNVRQGIVIHSLLPAVCA